MIYNITQTNDDLGFRDVLLTAAIEGYFSETWSAAFTLNKDDMTISGPVWQNSPAPDVAYEDVEAKDVPRWFRAMVDRMKPRIVEEHFQALIDARTAEELANTPS